MPLRIYNTLHRTKEAFEPLSPPQVRMYVCGVTVYDRCHIGHARANVAFDVIYRYLRYLGYQVTCVRNFTDVDDKIIKRSQELNVSWQELTQKYISEFTQDMKALGNLVPTIEPKATDHISDMISLIQTLIAKSLAYVAKGDVFYHVKSFKNYGTLSQKNIDELESGARVEVMESKTDPLDFALWKSAKPGEPSWDSPWGKGRPGWHIECSAMSMKCLGESFDIHGGGRDLIFPHHENEIAQSEGATEKPFVKYWLHNGFVNINAHKMSKSLGNILSIQEVLQQQDWEVVRAFLIAVHYRSPVDFTEGHLSDSHQALERYYATIKRVKNELALDSKNFPDSKSIPQELLAPLQGLLQKFKNSMDDDFNTTQVLGHIFEAVRAMNKILDQSQGARVAPTPSRSLCSLGVHTICQKFLEDCDQIFSVLGCFGTDAEGFFKRQEDRVLAQTNVDEAKVLNLIEQRKLARTNKDFKKADEIRKELAILNIILKDNPDGTTEWSVKG